MMIGKKWHLCRRGDGSGKREAHLRPTPDHFATPSGRDERQINGLRVAWRMQRDIGMNENGTMVKNAATSLGEITPYSLVPRSSCWRDSEDVGYFWL